MARITLVTGGARSGKSSHAQRLAESAPGPRAFIATCPCVDDEMGKRIRKHRDARDPSLWYTIEETHDLPDALRRASKYRTVLVDCLTLWISNLMLEVEEVSEEDIARRCEELLGACREHTGDVILVTNETGMGVVPDNALARRFRDLMGRCNQTMAAGADSVILTACGLPINLK